MSQHIDPRTDSLPEAAALYMTAGLHILALTGKRPNGKVHGDQWSWEESYHGAPESVSDFIALRAAFGPESGTTGIAILIPESMLVADVDTERAAVLLKSFGYEDSEDTVAAQTKNGLHIWFVAPGADRNRWVGDGEEPNPNRTLLMKGFGGYVVAPPSLHFDADGNVDGQYRWGANSLVDGLGNLRFPDIIPAALARKFAAQDAWEEFHANGVGDKREGSHFELEYDPAKKWWEWTPVWNYHLEGLERAIETAADGNQNNVIHWAAMTAREEGVPSEVAMERLLAAAVKGGHPKNRARDTIKGAYKRAPRGG